MNFKNMVTAGLLLTTLLSPLAALAGPAPTGMPNHPRRDQVNTRENRQLNRINQGVKNGKLTKSQAQQLRGNEKSLQAQKNADYKANGGAHLTKAQQGQLNKQENQSSKQIYNEKHP